MSRFVDIDLSRLPVPDAITFPDYEVTLAGRMADLTTRLTEKDINYDVGGLETSPLKITEEHASYYDILLTSRVNDAVRATLLSSAEKSDLDHKAAEFGVVRRVVTPADPTANPPTEAVMEDDDILRRRRQLAPEALSTAGPAGAYVFHGLASHPHVANVKAYGPESLLCEPGEVLLVFASNQGDAIPTDQLLDSAAEYLDARIINYAVTPQRVREVSDDKDQRPLTDKVIVEACTGLDYSVDVVLKVPPGPGIEIIRAEAEKALLEELASRRKIGFPVYGSAVTAAVHVEQVEDTDITITVDGNPVEDVVPDQKQLARVTNVNVTAEVVS
ncbi:baseplate assembly protein [Roseibium sp.]|uniref:baseplate assembly protein n=1 Tax=Roseibium sp. TaxID=1936156 RepID=UPI003B5259A2